MHQTAPIHRAISVIALAQTWICVFGTFYVMAAFKETGYGILRTAADYSRDALFVRNSGWMLLWIPAVWGVCAIVTAKLDLHPWVQRGLIVLGVAMILIGLYAYIDLGDRIHVGNRRLPH